MSSNNSSALLKRKKDLFDYRHSYYGSDSDLNCEGCNIRFSNSRLTNTTNVKIKKLTLENLNSWKNGLENILDDYYGLYYFNEFLKSEYSTENLNFWLACEKFKTIPSRKKIDEVANNIYQEFIAIGAENEVNLDGKLRRNIIEQMNAPSKKLFESAQSSIFNLMAKDSYSRFLKSNYYLDLLKEN